MKSLFAVTATLLFAVPAFADRDIECTTETHYTAEENREYCYSINAFGIYQCVRNAVEECRDLDSGETWTVNRRSYVSGFCGPFAGTPSDEIDRQCRAQD